MTKTRQSLFTYAEVLGIPRSELVDVLRARGVTGRFDPEEWDRYMNAIDAEALERKKRRLIEQYSCDKEEPVSFAQRCTEALQRWGSKKWLIPPVKLTSDGQYINDPNGVVEGELVYAGVLNE